MKKPTDKIDMKKEAKQLAAELVASFFYAYKLHQNGVTEQELLIRFDIWAAGGGMPGPQSRITAHRRAIQSAVNAYDKDEPFKTACVRFSNAIFHSLGLSQL